MFMCCILPQKIGNYDITHILGMMSNQERVIRFISLVPDIFLELKMETIKGHKNVRETEESIIHLKIQAKNCDTRDGN